MEDGAREFVGVGAPHGDGHEDVEGDFLAVEGFPQDPLGVDDRREIMV